MKKILLTAFVAGLMAFKPATMSSTMAPDTYMVDVKKSTIDWACKGVGKEHVGTINFSNGSMVVDTKQIKSGFFYVDVRTMKNLDVKDEGFNKQLVDHLKSPDFFNVVKYPDATLKITQATRLDVPDGQQNYQIKADLKIKNITKPVEFPATVLFGKKDITVKADLTIDRTKWQINYNSGNYFKDLGDKLIEDNITLKVNVVMNKK